MKLIKIEKDKYAVDYFYENDIIKQVWNDGEIDWIKNRRYHKEDGAAKQNCGYCKNICFRINSNNKYKRHFYLNSNSYYPNEFAKTTNHKICLICKDFCKQECFME